MLKRNYTITAVLVGLFLFSSTSHSRSSRHYEEPNDPDKYNVELTGTLGQIESEDSTIETTFSVISAEIFFDEVDSLGKPLVYAAFLDKKTSLTLFQTNADTDIKVPGFLDSTQEDTRKGITLNYISEEDNYILGFTFSSGDTTADDIDVAETDSKGINIGKYITDSSSIELSYTQHTTEFISTIAIASNETTTDIAKITYRNLLDFGSDKYIYFSGSASQIKQEASGVEATNQEFDLTTEVFFNDKASLIASVAINSGDDLFSEGKIISGGGTYFITPEYAVSVMGSIFTPDIDSSQEQTSAFISGIARF